MSKKINLSLTENELLAIIGLIEDGADIDLCDGDGYDEDFNLIKYRLKQYKKVKKAFNKNNLNILQGYKNI